MKTTLKALLVAATFACLGFASGGCVGYVDAGGPGYYHDHWYHDGPWFDGPRGYIGVGVHPYRHW